MTLSQCRHLCTALENIGVRLVFCYLYLIAYTYYFYFVVVIVIIIVRVIKILSLNYAGDSNVITCSCMLISRGNSSICERLEFLQGTRSSSMWQVWDFSCFGFHHLGFDCHIISCDVLDLSLCLDKLNDWGWLAAHNQNIHTTCIFCLTCKCCPVFLSLTCCNITAISRISPVELQLFCRLCFLLPWIEF